MARWVCASSRPTCSCWPEMSRSPRVACPSCAAVASDPLTQARLRPSRCTVRRTTISAPAAGSPSADSRASVAAGSRGRNSAWTSASSAPVRTASACARPPSTRCSASTRMLLPAPVSPVSTLNPGAKCASSSSMMAKARTRSSSSMAAHLSRAPRHSAPTCYVPPMADASLAELRELSEHALADGLRDAQRGRWRELVAQLLGRTQSHEGRRKHLRAAAGLDVHVLEPDDLRGLVTSTIGAGGLSMAMPAPLPVGTPLALSIQVAQRKVPLFVKAQVAWVREGEIGAVFTDAVQSDRELLEAIAVRALLTPGGMLPP